jgi:hypothetical protein
MSNKQRPNKKSQSRRNRKTVVTKTVRQPVSKGKQIVNKGALKNIRIRHTEYLKDLYYIAVDGNIIIPINPGLAAVFPWLSGIAERFETYRFNALTFRYITAVSTTTDGAISLVPDYDAADDNTLVSKVKLFSYEDAARGPIWQNLNMNCSKSNLTKYKERFIRNNTLSDNLDIKTYDVGNLIIVLTGVEANKFLGELWVEYDITLMTPQMEEPETPMLFYAANFTESGVTKPFKQFGDNDTITTTLGSLKDTFFKEGINTIGAKKAGHYLVDLVTAVITDTGVDNPAMALMTWASQFINVDCLNAAVEETASQFFTGSQRWIVQNDTKPQSWGSTDGANVNWSGWSGFSVSPLDAVLQFAITEISPELAKIMTQQVLMPESYPDKFPKEIRAGDNINRLVYNYEKYNKLMKPSYSQRI